MCAWDGDIVCVVWYVSIVYMCNYIMNFVFLVSWQETFQLFVPFPQILESGNVPHLCLLPVDKIPFEKKCD